MAILADYDNLRTLVTTPVSTLAPQFLLADTAAELPTSSYGLYEGCRAYAKDTNSLYLFDGAAWNAVGGSQAWPVGSVFVSVVSTDPNTLLGYGTWSAIASGQVLVGLNSGDTDFDTVEETGGSKTSTPSAHAGTAVGTSGAGSAHSHTVPATATGAVKIGTSSTTGAANSHTHTSDTEGAHTHAAGSVTQPNTHSALSVVQPYFVVYFWKRTA